MALDHPARLIVTASGAAVDTADGAPADHGFVSLGVDGSTARYVVVDVAGRQVLVGAAAAGAAPAGNPVLVGGSDGSAVRNLSLDSDGNVVVVGPGGPVGVSGSVEIVGPVGLTGFVNVLGPVGITGPVGLTGPLERISNPVGLTGPLERIVDPVGITGPVGVTGAIQVSQPTASVLNARVQGPGAAGSPTGGLLTVQGASGAQPQSVVGAVGPGAAPSSNPVFAAGQDGSSVRPFRTDQVGNQQVVGAVPAGSVPSGAPVRVAGSDGNAVRDLRLDSLGRVISVGPGAAGAAPTGAPVLAAGQDGSTVVRTFRTDQVGNQQMVGALGAGSVPSGSPVRVAGQDGNVIRDLRLDSLGRSIVVGPGPAGSVPTGAPVLVAGSDGSLVRTSRLDDAGRHVVVGPALVGSGPTGAPVRIAGSDGSALRDILTDSGGRPVAVLSDGLNGPVAVKASSTVPTAADRALVVVLSPNQQAIPVSSSPATATSGLNFGSVSLGGGTSGSLFPVRATTYNEQSANAQRSISSSSADDTSAGTGARTVEITYYTSAGVGPFTETVTLNGTTPVNTVATNICFIERMVVISAGTGGTNAGTITLFVSTGGAGGTIGTIGIGTIVSAIGDGSTLWAHHYVPAATTANITGLSVGASQPATFHLKSKAIGVANAAEEVISGLSTTTAAFQRNYGSPIVVLGPARITAYGVPSTNGVTLNTSFDFFETSM